MPASNTSRARIRSNSAAQHTHRQTRTSTCPGGETGKGEQVWPEGIRLGAAAQGRTRICGVVHLRFRT